MSSLDPIQTDAQSKLRRAAQLMQSGQKEDARQLVAEILKSSPENADAWYLYALLVEQKDKKMYGVQKALSSNPQHTRAQQLLVELNKPDDLFDSILPGHHSASVAPVAQPIVYVNVNQTNANNADAKANNTNYINSVPVKKMNGVAFWVGFIVSGLFCIFGLAHLFNGKVGGALGAFLIGSIAWPLTAAFLFTISAGICIVALLPLHVYLAYSISKRGATITA